MSSTEKNPSLMSLPYDLVLNCIAHVSRWYYPTLLLVSKSFQSLLASPELYQTRSDLGRTESCLYLSIRYDCEDYRWFSLYWEPDQTRTSDKGYVLDRLPSPYPPNADFSGLVVVGYNIYNIGGVRSIFSSGVSVLDCRYHTWRKAPSLLDKLRDFTTRVIGQNIFVTGIPYSSDDNSSQVFDIRTQVWNANPTSNFYNPKSECVDEKVDGCYCKIDNILYSSRKGEFRWYDTKIREWRELKGLVGELPKLTYHVIPHCSACNHVRLADYGGKMAVIWVHCSSKKREIWCAEVTLERGEIGEIWGKVERYDKVLTVPGYCGVVKVLAVTF